MHSCLWCVPWLCVCVHARLVCRASATPTAISAGDWWTCSSPSPHCKRLCACPLETKLWWKFVAHHQQQNIYTPRQESLIFHGLYIKQKSALMKEGREKEMTEHGSRSWVMAPVSVFFFFFKRGHSNWRDYGVFIGCQRAQLPAYFTFAHPVVWLECRKEWKRIGTRWCEKKQKREYNA